VRAIWHHNVKEGNFLVKKAKDVLVLLGLGATILLSVAISAATGAFTGFALELVDLQDSTIATVLAKVVGVALGLLTSTGLFLFLFWRLPKVQSPFRKVAQGAVLAAVLFEVLKRVGAFYIERTTANPLYGSFAVVVGLLIWINIVSRMLLICAAWTVTAPYDSDVEPSGTASVAAAEQAGIPTEFADEDPDAAPALQEDGAPSPLAAAVQGQTPSQDVAEGRGSQDGAPTDSDGAPARSGRRVQEHQKAGSGGTVTMVRPPVQRFPAPHGKAEDAVRGAAQFTAGALGMVVTAVLLHVARTIRDVLRR
jgi:membrane protein